MIATQERQATSRIGGSFRDPSGYVFRRGGQIFRAIDETCYQTLRSLDERGVLPGLVERGLLVATRFVEDRDEREDLAAEHAGYERFLEHAVVSPISYPYEWSISMLADAALATLDLQESLLGGGWSLKDATAYNIQFVDGRPVFIDVASIERPPRLDLWYAMGQFGRMFTFPLLLCRHHGWDLRSYFVANLDGRDLEQVARGLGRLARWRPRMLLDVTLPLLFGRRANRGTGDGRALLEQKRDNPRAQLMNLERLRRKIGKLASGYRPGGAWSDYNSQCNYSQGSEHAKKDLVRRFLQAARPARVLDAGCNTGDYSYLAAECGARVVAADADHDTIEVLYRRLRRHPAAITPMVVNLSNPSPAIGYRNCERPSWLERNDADCVLALALIHHLLVGGNLSLAAIRDFFAELTSRHLVLEFVPPGDNMFQRLLKFRTDSFGEITLEACREVFGRRFQLLEEHPIPGSSRTLLCFRKRDGGS